MDCWNNVKPLDFRCHSVMMAVNNRNFSWQRQEGLRGADTKTCLQIIGGQTLKQVCRMLVGRH